MGAAPRLVAMIASMFSGRAGREDDQLLDEGLLRRQLQHRVEAPLEPDRRARPAAHPASRTSPRSGRGTPRRSPRARGAAGCSRTAGAAASGPPKSGRPTSPTKRQSPVNTIDGSGLRGGFVISSEMDSGRWPGVCSTSSTTGPRLELLPVAAASRTGTGRPPPRGARPARRSPPRAAGCPETWSAWRCVSTM